MALNPATEVQGSGEIIDHDGRLVVVPTGIGGGATGGSTELTLAKRFGGGKTPVATSVSTSGDNTIHTPASGKTLTVFWVGLSSSQNNAAEVLVTVKLGAKVCYEWYLGNPGAFSHWEPIPADNPDDALIVNLSAGSNPVLVNATYTEA